MNRKANETRSVAECVLVCPNCLVSPMIPDAFLRIDGESVCPGCKHQYTYYEIAPLLAKCIKEWAKIAIKKDETLAKIIAEWEAVNGKLDPIDNAIGHMVQSLQSKR